MSNFDEKIIERLKRLEREVERLRVKERPDSGSGVTDHGALTGLSDNDHPQYLLTTGKAADSDKLDNIDSSGFVQTSGAQTVAGVKTFSSIPVLPATNPTIANQAVRKGFADATYLGISAKAADSDKLDGLNSTDFGRPVFLTEALTSTAWDGDSYSSNGGKTLIDLSAVFDVPDGVKAVLLECAINDSGSLTYSTYGGAWIVFSGQNDEAWGGQGINLEKEPNDAHRNAHMIVACNPDGDIYYRINASGTGTMDVVLKVWGYWL